MRKMEIYSGSENHTPFLSIVMQDDSILAIMLGVVQSVHKGLVGNFSKRSIIIGGPLIIDNDVELLEQLLTGYIKMIENSAIFSQFRNLRELSLNEKLVFLKLSSILN